MHEFMRDEVHNFIASNKIEVSAFSNGDFEISWRDRGYTHSIRGKDVEVCMGMLPGVSDGFRRRMQVERSQSMTYDQT